MENIQEQKLRKFLRKEIKNILNESSTGNSTLDSHIKTLKEIENAIDDIAWGKYHKENVQAQHLVDQITGLLKSVIQKIPSLSKFKID